jgi:hypothetical protein
MSFFFAIYLTLSIWILWGIDFAGDLLGRVANNITNNTFFVCGWW